jgi:hypothetical protein
MDALRKLWGDNFFVFRGVVAQEPRPPQGQAERFVDVLDREDGGRQPQESGAQINHRPRDIVICTTFALPRGQCNRSLPTRRSCSMTDRQAPTLCRATSVVPSKVNVARGHFVTCSSSLAKI